MKALYKMSNWEKGKLLIGLFPEELANIQNTIKQQCSFYLKEEENIRKEWNKRSFITPEFWYQLIQIADNAISQNQSKYLKKPNWFIDQFFDGHNALFTIHCLTDFAKGKECDYYLKEAINLLFSDDKIFAQSKTLRNDNSN